MAHKGGAASKPGATLSKNLLSMKFMQRGAAAAASGDDSELWGPAGSRQGPDIAPMTPDVPPVGRRSFLGHRAQPVADPPSTPSTPSSTPNTPASAGSAGHPNSANKSEFPGRPLFKRLSTMSPPMERPGKSSRKSDG